MINILTSADRNYLIKGLTLYESLLETSSDDFLLHFLSLDDESFKILDRVGGNVIAYHYSEFDSLSELRKSNYYLFCCASASALCDRFVQDSDVFYCDSDILFHKDIHRIKDAIGDNSVGIFRHRQFNGPRPEGAFNVGVVFFKSDNIGKYVSGWWHDAVISGRYQELSTCGDQKYLDLFPYMCKGKLFIDGEIGHGAPWQWQLYEDCVDGNIIWNGESQELVFSHFSSLQIDPFIPSTSHHCYTHPSMYNTPWLKKIYVDYYNRLMSTKSKYNL